MKNYKLKPKTKQQDLPGPVNKQKSNYDEIITKVLKKERKASPSQEKIIQKPEIIPKPKKDNGSDLLPEDQLKVGNLNLNSKVFHHRTQSGKNISSIQSNTERENDSFQLGNIKNRLDEKILTKQYNTNEEPPSKAISVTSVLLHSQTSRKNLNKFVTKDIVLRGQSKRRMEESDKIQTDRVFSISKKDPPRYKLNLKSNNITNINSSSNTSRMYSNNLSNRREAVTSVERAREAKSKSKEKDIPKIIKRIKVDMNYLTNQSQTKNEKKLKKYLSNFSNVKNPVAERKELEINSILKEPKNMTVLQVNLSTSSKMKKDSIDTEKNFKAFDSKDSKDLSKDLSTKPIQNLGLKKQLIGLKTVALDLINDKENNGSSKNLSSINSSNFSNYVIPTVKTCLYESDGEGGETKSKSSFTSLHEARRNKNLEKQSRSCSEGKYDAMNKLQQLTENLRKGSVNSQRNYESNSPKEKRDIKSEIFSEEEDLRMKLNTNFERNILRSKTLKELSESRFKHKLNKLEFE